MGILSSIYCHKKKLKKIKVWDRQAKDQKRFYDNEDH